MRNALFSYILILLISHTPIEAKISLHPRLLLTSADLDSIAINLQKNGAYEHDFTLFIKNNTYINSPVPLALDPSSCHHILDKIMKNSFLYLLFSKSHLARCASCYGGSETKNYLANMKQEVNFLIQESSSRDLKTSKNLESIGYAIKALAIALDWAYALAPQESGIAAQISNTLKDWGQWLTSKDRYYGSVFENHAPWDTKALAYLSIALGDSDLLENKQKKIQYSRIPLQKNATVSGEVYLHAKPFFEQIMEAANYISKPDGGWHEGPSYFTLKELPELIEYAELISVYNSSKTYDKKLFTTPIFKKAGLFLWNYSTPDGYFMKKGDTGQKSCRPAELFRPEGFSYGDINNIGAGYIATYHLRRLFHRLQRYPDCSADAALLKSYIDCYCGDDINNEMEHEAQINLIYKFIWDQPEVVAPASSFQLPVALPQNHYNQQTASLVSRHGAHTDPLATIVRFDAMPHFFSNHQHFSNGHFIIFKKGNLAIDGGRYISGDDIPRSRYSEKFYRSSFAHNVVFFGDSAQIGQDKFDRAPDQAPYTMSQIKSFRKGSINEEDLSVFIPKDDERKEHLYTPTIMQVDLKPVYTAAQVAFYARTLVHLVPGQADPASKPDFVVIYDKIKMADQHPLKASWQMHFRDNGIPPAIQNNLIQLARREVIPVDWQFKNFGAVYNGVLTIKTLLPNSCEYLFKNVASPDSLCSAYWNGRVMEESNRILLIPSPNAQEHEFLHVLIPAANGDETFSTSMALLRKSIVLINGTVGGRTLLIRADSIAGQLEQQAHMPALCISIVENTVPYHYEIPATQSAAINEHIIVGLQTGRYRITMLFQDGSQFVQILQTRLSQGNSRCGTLIFNHPQLPPYQGYAVMVARD
ncbi:MAG TPA: heparinase II/III family protein [bacterium]|mgnify:CR=1 FL=1|nr:heparinase II/III family protein [bacterium]